MNETDQARADEETERLRKTLEAEFEEFICMAAHNLRESAREVASFSQLMAETSSSTLDADAVEYLARIQRGAANMQALLADIVDYWATGAGDRQPGSSDMEAVLRQSLLSTEQQIRERSAVVTHDALPAAVTGNFEMLTKLLHHLITNAIEYCESPVPLVHISCVREELEWVISVRDNGPGIDPAFQSRIFGAFKRLHGSEHPGNGLGLSFCKKVVEGYGGRMWVESTPGAGSTFYFTLLPADRKHTVIATNLYYA